MTKVAINGMGRIGRAAFKIIHGPARNWNWWRSTI